MAIAQVLLMCLGLCLLAKNADSVAPTITTAALTAAENQLTVTGTLAVTGSPTDASITSQPNAGQIGITTGGVVSVNAGYVLDYEQGSSLVIVALVSNTDGSASVTATITVSDVVEEFDNPILSVCLSSTLYDAGSQLFTKIASLTTVTATYSMTAQTPDNGDLTFDSSTNYVKVASGKTLTAATIPVHTATLKLISSAPAVTTSTAVVTITFGCSTSGAATIMFGSVTLLVALLVAMLK